MGAQGTALIDHPYIESEQAKAILRLAARVRTAAPAVRAALFDELTRTFPGYRPANDKERMWLLLEMMNLRQFLLSRSDFDVCDGD
ncbi:MAG: hypothetical protein KME03_01850 [Aphanocapsa lilacina HA4352-LM1]|jgi:hypothetical protein|nr:hypothetical protein [Aphanocapsa lilacina HA4352-LM1]